MDNRTEAEKAIKIGPLESAGLHFSAYAADMIKEFEKYQRRKMMNKITMEGNWQTESGQPVKVLTTTREGANGYCVVGLVQVTKDQQNVECWKIDGTRERSGCNLVPVPVKQDTWGVVNKEGKLVIYYSGDGAWYRAGLYQDTFNGDKVVRITWED